MTATVFFCDITGTIEGNHKNTKKDFQDFNELVSCIKQKNQSDYLFLSLVSTDNVEIVNEKLKSLSAYCNNSITFEKQFFENGYTDGKTTILGPTGKCEQIVYYLNEISTNYSIDSIILADDLEMLHEMIDVVSKNFSWKDKLHSIIPTKKEGLIELNELLKEHLKDNQKSKIPNLTWV